MKKSPYWNGTGGCKCSNISLSTFFILIFISLLCSSNAAQCANKQQATDKLNILNTINNAYWNTTVLSFRYSFVHFYALLQLLLHIILVLVLQNALSNIIYLFLLFIFKVIDLVIHLIFMTHILLYLNFTLHSFYFYLDSRLFNIHLYPRLTLTCGLHRIILSKYYFTLFLFSSFFYFLSGNIGLIFPYTL